MSDKSLTRVDIANVVKKEIGISRSESSYFVDTIINEIVKSLIEKKILKISSFGTLKLRYKKERIGRNPKTKELKNISARNVIKFKPSDYLINEVNKKNEK